MSTAAPHKTAIQRWSLSRPVALALEDGLFSHEDHVLRLRMRTRR